MKVTDLHFELHVRDLEAARRFYVDQLELPVLQETPGMRLLAVRVGHSRMSIFGNRTDQKGPGPSQIILAVDDIEKSVAALQAKGLAVSGPPVTAGQFLRFVTLLDPDGNTVAVAEYLRSAIEPI
jgi:predicted enzyme related to lactoylglutathione lyase